MDPFKPMAIFSWAPIIAGLILLVVCTAAEGGERAGEMFSLSGFGTLGVVHSSEDQADFVANSLVPKGAGYTRQWSADVDSRLGVQLIGNFTPRVSATVQVIAEQRYDGEYVPHVEWANIKYQVTPQLAVRLGRTALASFLISDSRKVGYVNPWVRPPDEVYSLVPVFSSDGVDAIYRLQRGDFVHTLRGVYGETITRSRDGGRSRARNQWTISDTMEHGPATLRIAYVQADARINVLDAVFDGFRQFGAQGMALADRYDPDHKRVTFIAIGGAYEPGDWFAMAEWGTYNLHSVFGERTVWYVSGGRRIGTVTPYVTYARAKANSNTSDPGLTLSGLPPELAGAAASLNGALNAALATVPVQQSISAGARWDLRSSIAVKLQYDRKYLGRGSAGTFVNLQPGFARGGSVNLFSASLDFVW